jgi:hypothetical protein
MTPHQGEDGQDEDLGVRSGLVPVGTSDTGGTSRSATAATAMRKVPVTNSGEGLHGNRDHRDDPIGGSARPGSSPQPEADGGRDQQHPGQGGQHQGVEEAPADDGPDRHPRVERGAEVSPDHPAHPFEVPGRSRPVQAQALAERLHLLGGGGAARRRLAQDDGGGVAGEDLGPGEDQDRDGDERRQPSGQAPGGVAHQGMAGGGLSRQARRPGSCTSRWRRRWSPRRPAPGGGGRPATWRRSG